VQLIWIGTSGYSYSDWKGNFYPEGIKEGDMLSYYSTHYSFTEINSTYYRMPNSFMFKNMDERTPEDFKFSVKVHSSFTHSRDASKEDTKSFLEALRPIEEKGKLGSILFQFPNSFHYTKENMDYLSKIREDFKGSSLCYEFRNASWTREETIRFLKAIQTGWVCVDEPPIPGLVRPAVALTSDTAYVRFHGRNSDKWYDHKEAYERYDYLYTEKELGEWVSKIKYIDKNAKNTFVAFNNHFRAQGAKNASMLKRLIMDA
jgi:uncharacterized protein YecE (DUF72 family)